MAVRRGLGFYLDLDECYFQKEGEAGHIEIALRAIKEAGLERRFNNQKRWTDPVDFLVYAAGAIKIGNRWIDRVVTYCPNAMPNKMYSIIYEYRRERYKIDEVQEPMNYESIFRMFR